MAGENKWPASRKRAAVIFAAIMLIYLYLLYIGIVSFPETIRTAFTLGLPISVYLYVSKREEAKKKRQDKQEVDARKTFREKHDMKSPD
jgi:hypothetical protein